MKIAIMTNTYLPHVGGVARSVATLVEEARRQRHEVLVVCPTFPNAPRREKGVLRLPALQNFNGSDFSMALPIPSNLSGELERFDPQIVHAHHPFFLGDTALRTASFFSVPLVFTYHTMYESYTHYTPVDSSRMRTFVIELSTGYSNLADHVIAPSAGVADLLLERGVSTPISVIPTGVDVQRFARGDGRHFRKLLHIPQNALVVGHVGRLAPEKNLPFLARAAARFLSTRPDGYFLVVGEGPSAEAVQQEFRAAGIAARLRMAGTRQGQELVDAYHAIDIFAFASKTETQGLVLAEALAAGTLPVALDAIGVRDVVVDKKNGFLVTTESAEAFVLALQTAAALRSEQRQEMRDAARQTLPAFSQAECCRQVFDLYAALRQEVRRFDKQAAGSTWQTAVRQLETEWEIWANRAASIMEAIDGRDVLRLPLLRRLRRGWAGFRRLLGRNELVLRLLRLPRAEPPFLERGLIMIQIDGLARTQFERAIVHGKLPFLRRLLRKSNYRLFSFYSGLPSSTPAVQGELFYGVKSAVPAFEYFDRERAELTRMYERDPVQELERKLARSSSGLLQDGSSYSNIYSGGAANASYCASTFGMGNLFQTLNPYTLGLFILVYSMSALRVFVLLVIELCLALYDFCKGVISGREFSKELKFISSRVAICILLRELITIGATIEAARGAPIIHLNYLGYDEQSHRRGPSSAFAHWSLKGIDGAIKRIWRSAKRSSRRYYEVWIYSDHGQESVVPFERITNGETITAAIARVFEDHVAGLNLTGSTRRGVQLERAQWLGGRLGNWLGKAFRSPLPRDSHMILAAMGPIGHLYFTSQATPEYLQRKCAELVQRTEIPIVCMPDGPGKAIAWTKAGRFLLPDEAAKVLGPAHPFIDDIGRDLVDLCHCENAGDILIAGWRKGLQPLSFVVENGAHGGPGTEETRGFLLLPGSAHVLPDDRRYFRPAELRELALRYLQRVPRHPLPVHRERRDAHSVRLLSYNIHSCFGIDDHLSPGRIAEVIAAYAPDLVALQEVDVHLSRSGKQNQVQAFARELGFDFFFFPSLQSDGGFYGNAVLSRYPLSLVRADHLPRGAGNIRTENRAAILLRVALDGRQLYLLNTHLGLLASERRAQMAALLSEQWILNPQYRPLIVCGDFNFLPYGPSYRKITRHLSDAQLALAGHRPQRTFRSNRRMGRIDHVFVSKEIKVLDISVPRTVLTRKASDHLPIVTEFKIVAEAPELPEAEQKAAAGLV